MNDKARLIFGDETAGNLESIVKSIDKGNMSVQQIVVFSRSFDVFPWHGLDISALSTGHPEIADKLEQAKKLVGQQKIENYKNAIKSGTQDEFLKELSMTEKAEMIVLIELYENGSHRVTRLNHQEKKCIKILRKSMDEDVKQKATNDGFLNVDEWKAYNERMEKTDLEDFGLLNDEEAEYHRK